MAADEEEALRRRHERQQIRRPDSGSREARAARRTAQRELERAEQDVARLETRIAGITAALEDPDLYTTPDGVSRAQTLGAELDSVRTLLEDAIACWERAVELTDTAGPTS